MCILYEKEDVDICFRMVRRYKHRQSRYFCHEIKFRRIFRGKTMDSFHGRLIEGNAKCRRLLTFKKTLR